MPPQTLIQVFPIGKPKPVLGDTAVTIDDSCFEKERSTVLRTGDLSIHRRKPIGDP